MAKTLAVGDIHCKPWIIDKVSELVENYDKIVFVGDIIDDWSATPQDSVDTAKKLYLLYREYPDKIVVTKSNHDLLIYYRQARGQIGGIPASRYMLWDIPENKYLVDWLSSLPVVTDIDGVLYSHAGVTSSFMQWVIDESAAADSKQAINFINKVDPKYLQGYSDSPIWARPYGTEYDKWDAGQVFGHTPSRTCHRIHDNIWCIDTFSTEHDGTPIGDGTVLEVMDGKQFLIKDLDNLIRA